MADSMLGDNVARKHPTHTALNEIQARDRASYVATRAALVPFLVPHRFEGKDKSPESLVRSQYGFGIGLNTSYLQEIFGHIRGATSLYNWGPMDGTEESTAIIGKPEGGLALRLWEDATRDNVTWKNFFMRKVMEWLLSAPGGFVMCETPTGTDGVTLDIAQAKALGVRPYTRFVPWSQVEDHGRFELGYRWIKLVALEGKREPGEDDGGGTQQVRILYFLNDEGETEISRVDTDGDLVGSTVNLGKIVDRQGQVTLPIVPVAYGEWEVLDYIGTGLIGDLSDIIIDMFNIWSETREGFRDAAFGITSYRGNQADSVQAKLDEGSRFISLGDDDNAELNRVAGNVEEVVQGLSLMDSATKAWDAAARRNAATAQARQQAKSGVALQAEFQLDLAPLLIEVAETMDQIESDAMFILGQLGGFTPESLAGVEVVTNTDFSVEEEASRVARLMADFRKMGLPIPEEIATRMIMAWAEATELLDLDEDVALAGVDATATVRDVIQTQAAQAVAEEATNRRNQAQFLLGATGIPTLEDVGGEG